MTQCRLRPRKVTCNRIWDCSCIIFDWPNLKVTVDGDLRDRDIILTIEDNKLILEVEQGNLLAMYNRIKKDEAIAAKIRKEMKTK